MLSSLPMEIFFMIYDELTIIDFMTLLGNPLDRTHYIALKAF